MTAALRRAESGGAPEDTAARLEALCSDGVEDGCIHANLLAAGAPPRAFPGSGGALDPEELWSRCYWPRVLRGGDPWGDLRVVVQYGPDGALEGSSVRGRYVDAELAACVADYAASIPMPACGAAVVGRYVYPFDHSTNGSGSARGEKFERWDVPERAIERCFDGLDVDRVVLRVHRSADGTLRPGRWIVPSLTSADRCVRDVLRASEVPGPAGRADLVLFPHRPARSLARRQVDGGPEPAAGHPPILHLSVPGFELTRGPSGTCVARVTVGADGYASHVAVDGCADGMDLAVRTPVMSWHWAVPEPTLTELTFVFRDGQVSIDADGRTLISTGP